MLRAKQIIHTERSSRNRKDENFLTGIPSIENFSTIDLIEIHPLENPTDENFLTEIPSMDNF